MSNEVSEQEKKTFKFQMPCWSLPRRAEARASRESAREAADDSSLLVLWILRGDFFTLPTDETALEVSKS